MHEDIPMRSGHADKFLEKAAAELLAEGGPIDRSWDTRRVHRSDPDIAAAIPSAAELLRTPILRPPYVSVLTDGTPLPSVEFCHLTRIADSHAPELVLDRELVAERMVGGASVKFNRMELWCPEIAAMARGFRQVCGRAIRCWGFVSHREQQMLPWHRDRAHVLAVQLEGRKRWQLGGPYPEGVPGAWQRIGRPDEIDTVLLQEGDVFYLPQGFAHCAAADTELSFHISFGLESTTAGDIRNRVLALLTRRFDREDPGELRRDNLALVLGDVRETLTGVATEIERLASTDPADLDQRLLAELVDELLPELPESIPASG